MKEASVRVSKEEANILLQALELYGGVHDAIGPRMGQLATAIMDKVIEAGLEAGWEQDAVVTSSTTVNIVSDGLGSYVEASPPQTSEDV